MNTCVQMPILPLLKYVYSKRCTLNPGNDIILRQICFSLEIQDKQTNKQSNKQKSQCLLI